MGLTREPPLVSNVMVCIVGVDEDDSSDELEDELSLEAELSLEEELSEDEDALEEDSELDEEASLEEETLVVLDSSEEVMLSEDVLLSHALKSNTKVSPMKWKSRDGLYPINISRFQSRTTDDDKTG